VREVLVEKLIKGEATTNFRQVDRRRRSLRLAGEELQVGSSLADFCEKCLESALMRNQKKKGEGFWRKADFRRKE
jgi:hypothetical protein